MIAVDLAIKKKLLWWEQAILGWALVSFGVIYSLQLHRLWDALACSCLSLLFSLSAIVFFGVGNDKDARSAVMLAMLSAGVGTYLGMAHHGLGLPGALLGGGAVWLEQLWELRETNMAERIREQEEMIRKLKEENARLKRP